jgi:hypothetical protein
LTATSWGDATGTAGVEVAVGGGVFDGIGDCVGATVGEGCVEEGVIATAVGVSVGTLEGKLQASIARTRTNVDNKLRDFIITSLLWVCPILPNPHVAGKRLFGVFRGANRADVLCPLDFILLAGYFMIGYGELGLS